MRILRLIVELLVECLCSWTLAYHLVLFTRLPARTVFIPFLLLFASFLALTWRQQRPARGGTVDRRLAWLVPVALLSGLFALTVSRPDNDDYSFFDRALVQLRSLGEPFLLTHTGDNVSGLPQISILHVMTSYEPFVAMTAGGLGLDPLSAYQNGAAFVAAFLLPGVYFLLYRQFRLSTSVAILSSCCALAFLILDGNLHRSFGSVALVRMWQGKTILWTLFLPITTLLAMRFLFRPSAYRLGLVAMSVVCAVGLSNSGVVLLPVLLLGLALSYLVCGRFTRKRLRRAVFLNAASAYPILIISAVKGGLLPLPHDMQAWVVGWPTVWWQNLRLVIAGRAELIRDLLILFALPLVCLRRPLGKIPVLLTLAFCLLFANPVLGPVWLRAVEPGSYWRLAYLFPLPWCAGLIAAALVKQPQGSVTPALRAGLAALTLVAIVHAYHYSVLSSAPPATAKAPWEYRFDRQPWAFARAAAPELQGKNVLTFEDMACILALTEPSVRLECGRGPDTEHVFSNAGNAAEGLRRARAQEFVWSGQQTPTLAAAFLRSLDNGVDAVLTPVNAYPSVAEAMKAAPGRWRVAARDADYVLLSRDDAGRRSAMSGTPATR